MCIPIIPYVLLQFGYVQCSLNSVEEDEVDDDDDDDENDDDGDDGNEIAMPPPCNVLPTNMLTTSHG